MQLANPNNNQKIGEISQFEAAEYPRYLIFYLVIGIMIFPYTSKDETRIFSGFIERSKF